MRIELHRVQFMPKTLEPGVLYFAEEYGAAAHLCACGCGTKIRTPIGPTEWRIQEHPEGITLRPSVGNWQQPCRSHYLITDGEVEWRGQWTEDQVQAGREREAARRKEYFGTKPSEKRAAKEGFFMRLWRKLTRQR
ncbi:DUF6527 family protein [soil metagenome]